MGEGPAARPDDAGIRGYNRRAWDRQVAGGSRWTVPVSADEVAAARCGELSLLLTASRPVPRDWFPALEGCRTLCLASAGGQQAPLLAAAGAEVVVLDNSPAQLARDREVADREELSLRTLEGDMADLSPLADDAFDLVFHPVSTCFVPDVRAVWREVARVLAPGGVLLSGHMHPVFYLFDYAAMERGELAVRHSLPHADHRDLPAAELEELLAAGEPLEFGHLLADLIGGQLEAGLRLTGYYDDGFDAAADGACPLSARIPTMFACRAERT